MTRISITVPQSLQQKLEITAKYKGISVSKLARELMNTQLDHEENEQRERTYQALQNMIGKVKDNITDASTTIDEVLYGGKQINKDEADE